MSDLRSRRVLRACVTFAIVAAACSSPDCTVDCAPSGVEVRWQPQELPAGATLQLCLDDDCRDVRAVTVPDSSGDQLVTRDYFAETTVRVRLVFSMPGASAASSIDGTGKFTRGRCSCPYLAFRLEDGRLTPVG